MGTSKFATMLHRNTNKMSIILIYALLEWILIFLLLLNSLFSHLITKFAIYFGLKPPCLWCSRVDHCFGIAKITTSYRDLVCDIHASEISQLGYCSNHKKLAKIRYMCKDCSFSQPFSPRSSADIEQKIAFLSSALEKKVENEETSSKCSCSCCDVSLCNDLYPPYAFFNGNRDKEEENGIDEDQDNQRSDDENCSRSLSIFQCKEIVEINEDDTTESTEKESVKVNAPDSPTEGTDLLRFPEDDMKILGSSPIKQENWSNFDDHFLVTIESIDSLNLTRGNFCEAQNLVNSVEDISVAASKLETSVQEVQLHMWEPELEYMNKAETENLLDQVPHPKPTQAMPFNDDLLGAIEIVIKDSDKPTSMEMCDGELIDHPQPLPSFSCLEEDSSRTCNHISNTFKDEDDESFEKLEEVSIEGRTMRVERIEENATKLHNHVEEKRELGMAEFLEGSFKSEMSNEEGILTTDHLKSVVKEERKARCALYEELEEERSANAIAAKQTMEMITRLQEEKATMHMEALQYQRMMDEQSEYDQEALQLLNELVVKVEKEKHELQMELEISRKKLLHYEAKERRMMKRKSLSELSRTHSSFSNSEDGDHLPVDFEHESVDEDSYNGHPESTNITPANGVINVEDIDLQNSKHTSILDESLADFEAEKLSILEKLKELEEKLFTLSDEEGEYYEDIKPVVLFPEENNTQISKEDEGNTSPDSNGSIPVSQRKSSISKFAEVNKRIAIEEEVEIVYERLQALEADREFLKQSISSLKKGDKGMDLLREILQYLRDLRSVELSTRKMTDASLT